MNWRDDIRRNQTLLSLPRWFGNTLDLTEVLRLLRLAGLPATVEDSSTLRLGDGRRARVVSRSPLPTEPGPGESSPAELLLYAPTFITPGMLEVARGHPGMLLVDTSEGKVWEGGQLIYGPASSPGVAAARYAVFAVARGILLDGGSTTDVATRTGLTREQAGDAICALGTEVHHSPLGWEASSRNRLLDFTLAAYPGFGGTSTKWFSTAPIAEQARRLSTVGGVLLSGRWAASLSDSRLSGDHITAFTPTGVDMAALGFQPRRESEHTVTLVHPEDHTLFATAQWNGAEGCTDDFITAITLFLSAAQNRDGAANLLRGNLQVTADLNHDLRWDLPQ